MCRQSRRTLKAFSGIGNAIARGAKCWSLEASIGYTPKRRIASKSGIATFMRAKWSKFVSTFETVMNNRGFWFILSDIHREDTGFLNIYTPNEPLH